MPVILANPITLIEIIRGELRCSFLLHHLNNVMSETMIVPQVVRKILLVIARLSGFKFAALREGG